MNQKTILYIICAIVSLYLLWTLSTNTYEGFVAGEQEPDTTLPPADSSLPPASNTDSGTFSAENLKYFSILHEFASLKGLCDANKLPRETCAKLRVNAPGGYETISRMLPNATKDAYAEYRNLISATNIDDIINKNTTNPNDNNRFKNIIRTMEELRNP